MQKVKEFKMTGKTVHTLEISPELLQQLQTHTSRKVPHSYNFSSNKLTQKKAAIKKNKKAPNLFTMPQKIQFTNSKLFRQ